MARRARGRAGEEWSHAADPRERRAVPFYGDTLYEMVAGKSADEAAEVIVRGAEADADEERFTHAVMEEIREKNGLTSAQLAEVAGRDVVERGPQNWEWFQGILRAIDRFVPHGSGTSVALFTHDVYHYLKNAVISETIDVGVSAAFTASRETVVVAHSLETVVAYNLLRQQGHVRGWKVPLFVTVGSPLAVSEIRKVVRTLAPPTRCPQCASVWFNAMDERDVVALYPLHANRFPLDPAAPGVDNKLDVRNRTKNRHGIAGYLDDKEVARRSTMRWSRSAVTSRFASCSVSARTPPPAGPSRCDRCRRCGNEFRPHAGVLDAFHDLGKARERSRNGRIGVAGRERQPVGAEELAQHGQQTIRCAEPRPGQPPLVDGELLAQGQVLEGELAVATDEERKEPEQVERGSSHLGWIKVGERVAGRGRRSQVTAAARLNRSSGATTRIGAEPLGQDGLVALEHRRALVKGVRIGAAVGGEVIPDQRSAGPGREDQAEHWKPCFASAVWDVEVDHQRPRALTLVSAVADHVPALEIIDVGLELLADVVAMGLQVFRPQWVDTHDPAQPLVDFARKRIV
jgi:hypothetical protein